MKNITESLIIKRVQLKQDTILFFHLSHARISKVNNTYSAMAGHKYIHFG